MAPTLGADEGGGYVPGGHEESWVKDRGGEARSRTTGCGRS